MINLFISAIVFGTVILYGAMGEILTEKSGISWATRRLWGRSI